MMAEINVTPLVDVMLVLLIIFMITAPKIEKKKTSQRKVAIRFLKEELEQTDDPELRESLARHLANELHALRSEEIERARTAWEEGSGQVLEDLQMLVGAGLLESLPADPLGGRWVIDMDGIVRSSVAAKTEAAHALRYERGLLEFMDL